MRPARELSIYGGSERLAWRVIFENDLARVIMRSIDDAQAPQPASRQLDASHAGVGEPSST